MTRVVRDVSICWQRLMATRPEAETIMGLVSETQRSRVHVEC